MALSKALAKDLSPKAVKKAVLAQSTQTPLTVYPAALALLGLAWGLLISFNVFTLAAMSIGGVLTASSWLWEYFVQGGRHASRFIQRYREELERKRHLALEQLEEDLDEARDEQGIKQIELFREKYENFLEILSRKLDENELTHQRYMAIAEQVYLGGLDNLESAALALKSVSAIDIEHIQKELDKLKNSSARGSDTRQAELYARLELRDKQIERAGNLLLANEKALTQLDMVSARIAEIKTQQGRAQIDLEMAMKELQHLITRADDYSNTTSR